MEIVYKSKKLGIVDIFKKINENSYIREQILPSGDCFITEYTAEDYLQYLNNKIIFLSIPRRKKAGKVIN